MIFGGKDKYEAECKLVSADGKTLIWAAEAGDRSLLFGAFKRGGQRKLAERLATRMNKDLFKSSATFARQEKPESPAGLVTRSNPQLPVASLAGSWVMSRSSKTASSFAPTWCWFSQSSRWVDGAWFDVRRSKLGNARVSVSSAVICFLHRPKLTL